MTPDQARAFQDAWQRAEAELLAVIDRVSAIAEKCQLPPEVFATLLTTKGFSIAKGAMESFYEMNNRTVSQSDFLGLARLFSDDVEEMDSIEAALRNRTSSLCH